jgi:hypothetical protein
MTLVAELNGACDASMPEVHRCSALSLTSSANPRGQVVKSLHKEHSNNVWFAQTLKDTMQVRAG